MARTGAALIALIALAGVACGSPATTTLAPSASIAPSVSPAAIDPANFVAQVDNPWFPLMPGTTLTYEGTKDDEPAVDVFEITGQTKVVDGVTCLVIRDTLTLGGKLAEKTEDWYVQDRLGNVWYFGEDTAEYDEQGLVTSTEGSWQAGVAGAQPGIFMPAEPQVGQSFQQEYYAGHAEDRFVVLLLSASANVRYGSFENALLAAEWTPLEPEVLVEKYYAKGIGLVKEIMLTGGTEGIELVSVKKP